MSTILKALKKLEQEQEGQRSDLQRPGADLITRQVFSKTVRFAWLRRIGLRWFFVLFVVLTAGIGVYLTGKDTETEINKNHMDPQTAPPDGSQPDGSQPDGSQTDQNAGGSGAPLMTPDGKNPSASPASSSKPAAMTGQINQTQVRPAKTGAVTDGSQPFVQEQPPLAERTKASPSSGEKSSGPEFPAPAASYQGAKPMTDGRLNVQAIAWSPIAEERMAVINDRVVHQGDAVDGFIVLAVEPDQIVVRSNDQTWLVPFGQGKSGN